MSRREGIATNESQRRSVATTLSLLDEVLCLFEEYGKGRELHSVCYEEDNQLSGLQRKRLIEEVDRMRKDMREIKEDLGLPIRTEDVGKKIWGHSVGFLEVLAEMESKHLRGYGQVPKSLADYLDPRVERLLHRMQGISTIGRGTDERT